MSSNLPIGVFDSGVGGLSILERIHQLLPDENLIYMADSANAPYGPKGDAFIVERSRQIMDFFVSRKAKVVVVACNTATAGAVNILRQEYEMPIIGMEPAIKPAARESRSGVIGVLATEGTLASDKFVDLKSRFDGKVEIITQPCPGLVEEIEKVKTDTATVKNLLQQYIPPLLGKGADTLVLGCTHYSFIKAMVKEIAGESVVIVDTDDAVARRLKVVLEEQKIVGAAEGVITFYSSGDIRNQALLISQKWGADVSVQSFDDNH